jgi:hypothetical protein
VTYTQISTIKNNMFLRDLVSLKRRDHSEGTGVDGKTILEWILGK